MILIKPARHVVVAKVQVKTNESNARSAPCAAMVLLSATGCWPCHGLAGQELFPPSTRSCWLSTVVIRRMPAKTPPRPRRRRPWSAVCLVFHPCRRMAAIFRQLCPCPHPPLGFFVFVFFLVRVLPSTKILRHIPRVVVVALTIARWNRGDGNPPCGDRDGRALVLGSWHHVQIVYFNEARYNKIMLYTSHEHEQYGTIYDSIVRIGEADQFFERKF